MRQPLEGQTPVNLQLDRRDALLIVDMQNDFLPGGALPVEQGEPLVETVNRWIARAVRAGGKIVASRDWHPADHSSFRDQGGPWPKHCVRDTIGARFHPDLELPDNVLIISKGTERDREQYSDFETTGLADTLRGDGVRRVWIAGVALDVCVRATALDAIDAGFEVHVIRQATRPIDEAKGVATIEELRRAGVLIETGDGDA
jgi:nicotinamidase/pyrazinamidase